MYGPITSQNPSSNYDLECSITNERINDFYNLYPAMKTESRPKIVLSGGRSCFVHTLLTVWEGCEHLFHFVWSGNLACFSPRNHGGVFCFPQRAILRINNLTCTTGVFFGWCGHLLCQCVYCLCLAHRCRFQPERQCNHWPQSITEGYRQYFKSQPYLKDHGHLEPVLVLPN